MIPDAESIRAINEAAALVGLFALILATPFAYAIACGVVSLVRKIRGD